MHTFVRIRRKAGGSSACLNKPRNLGVPLCAASRARGIPALPLPPHPLTCRSSSVTCSCSPHGSTLLPAPPPLVPPENDNDTALVAPVGKSCTCDTGPGPPGPPALLLPPPPPVLLPPLVLLPRSSRCTWFSSQSYGNGYVPAATTRGAPPPAPSETSSDTSSCTGTPANAWYPVLLPPPTPLPLPPR